VGCNDVSFVSFCLGLLGWVLNHPFMKMVALQGLIESITVESFLNLLCRVLIFFSIPH
jgi:hypothetical protein